MNFYSHGLLIGLGVLAGGLLLFYLARKKDLSTDFIFDLVVIATVGGLIGARVLYFIFYRDQFVAWYEVFYIWYGGLVSFGGLLGGILTGVFYLKARGENVWKWLDLSIIGLMTGWAIGRVGCLLNGDSVGILTTSKLAITGRFPTQVFESIWSLVVVGFCLIFYKYKPRELGAGSVFSAGLFLYGIGRFFIDIWRDEPVLFWLIKPGQLTSLIMISIALIIFGLINYKLLRRRHGGF